MHRNPVSLGIGRGVPKDQRKFDEAMKAMEMPNAYIKQPDMANDEQMFGSRQSKSFLEMTKKEMKQYFAS